MITGKWSIHPSISYLHHVKIISSFVEADVGVAPLQARQKVVEITGTIIGHDGHVSVPARRLSRFIVRN